MEAYSKMKGYLPRIFLGWGLFEEEGAQSDIYGITLEDIQYSNI